MKYEKLATKIGMLVDEKNAAYGSSFEQAGEFLRLLYPNGIPPEKYGDMLCVVRIFDKLKRVATKKGAFSESPYQDIVGYGLLGAAMDLEADAEQSNASLGISEEVIRETNNENLNTAKEDNQLVPVSCSVCNQFVTNVPKGMEGHQYAHDLCWNNKQSR